MLEHRRVRRFGVGAMPDQLDVAGEGLDTLALFLTPEVEPLSQLFRCFSNVKGILQPRLRLVKTRGRFES